MAEGAQVALRKHFFNGLKYGRDLPAAVDGFLVGNGIGIFRLADARYGKLAGFKARTYSA